MLTIKEGKIKMDGYDDGILSEGSLYTIEINNGTTIKKVIYKGEKMMGGKRMQCWDTVNKEQRFTNPSYVAVIIEENMDEMNHIIGQQAEHAWEGRIGE